MLIVAMTTLRVIYASVMDLRTDEAYYWTWSKENVLSFLDHPPMIAWFIRFGTAIFGDTNFGVRFAGVLAILRVADGQGGAGRRADPVCGRDGVGAGPAQ